MGRPRIHASPAEAVRAWKAAHPERVAEHARRWRARNAEKVAAYRAAERDRTYRVDRHTMYHEQGGGCAICGQPGMAKLVIDHDHESGAVRGLLCRPCNLGLGHFRDDPERLRQAADYLERMAAAGLRPELAAGKA